jgi:hypothetical protein
MHLNAVQELVRRPGPFVTIQTDVGRTTETARQELESRWTTIRHALEHQGVSEELLTEIGERLHEPPQVPGPARRTLVAESGQIILDTVQSGPARWPEVVDVDLLPDLAGWVAQGDRDLPFCLVVADREGADIEFHAGLVSTSTEEIEVQGPTFGITKVPEGDWKQAQYQRAVENTWQRTAGQIADAVRAGARRHRPRVVMLAGDVRECAEIERALEQSDPPDAPILRLESGGRAAGASEEALWQEVHRVLDEFEARDEEGVTGELLERTGQGAGAARGLDDVLEALVKGQVERLVVDLQEARQMNVDVADYPGLPLPETATGTLPADRVLLAAAAATDAEVRVLPKEQTRGQGVAAILRWAD